MATLNYEITTSGGVRAVDPETGAEVATCPATGTMVVQLLRPASGVIVRETYPHYPRVRSNVYYLDSQLKEVWRAERPSASDVYVSAGWLGNGVLRCATMRGTSRGSLRARTMPPAWTRRRLRRRSQCRLHHSMACLAQRKT